MTRLKNAALAAVVFGTAGISTTYLAAFFGDGPVRWAPPVFVVGVACIMVGMMVLGAATDRGVGRLAVPFAFVWVLLVGGFAWVFRAPQSGDLWLGLPAAAAIIIYGIGFAPVLVLPLAYALTFDSITLRPEDIERVRAAGAAREHGE